MNCGHVARRHSEFAAARFDPLEVALNVVGEEHGRGLVLLEDGLLVVFGCRVTVESELQFGPIRLLGRCDR